MIRLGANIGRERAYRHPCGQRNRADARPVTLFSGEGGKIFREC